MGILDEAIREHLDLKRRQGAGEDELSRLEDEAFGPPSRPGDPDFPEADAEAATGEEAQAAPEAATPAEAPSEEAPVVPEAAEPAAPAAEPEPAEGEAAEPAPAAPPTEETPGSAFYDAEAEEDEELDLDIDLDIDEEIERVGGLDVGDEPPAAADEGEAPPISSLDTVEHHFEDAIDEAEVVEEAEEAPGPPTEEDEAPSAAHEEGAEEDEEEDVLEETPEFLQDTPEDDELWFEQGEPKDFDF
jgi:hypothetical protein